MGLKKSGPARKKMEIRHELNRRKHPFLLSDASCAVQAGKYYFQYDVQFNNARDTDVVPGLQFC